MDIKLEDLGGNLPNVQNKLEVFLEIDHDPTFIQNAGKLIRPGDTNKKRWVKNKSEADLAFIMKEMGAYLERYSYI